jgi:hypothetical protein
VLLDDQKSQKTNEIERVPKGDYKKTPWAIGVRKEKLTVHFPR